MSTEKPLEEVHGEQAMQSVPQRTESTDGAAVTAATTIQPATIPAGYQTMPVYNPLTGSVTYAVVYTGPSNVTGTSVVTAQAGAVTVQPSPIVVQSPVGNNIPGQVQAFAPAQSRVNPIPQPGERMSSDTRDRPSNRHGSFYEHRLSSDYDSTYDGRPLHAKSYGKGGKAAKVGASISSSFGTIETHEDWENAHGGKGSWNRSDSHDYYEGNRSFDDDEYFSDSNSSRKPGIAGQMISKMSIVKGAITAIKGNPRQCRSVMSGKGMSQTQLLLDIIQTAQKAKE